METMSSKNQYFLLIENVEGCRYWKREEDLYSGHVVVRKPFNDANEFEVHHGSRFLLGTPVLVNREGGLPLNKVVAINEQEFDILLGIHQFDDKIRLDLHSSGRLKWACLLKDGDAVQVKFGKKSAPVAGTIRGTVTRPLQHNTTNHGLLFVVEITVGKVLLSPDQVSLAEADPYTGVWLCETKI